MKSRIIGLVSLMFLFAAPCAPAFSQASPQLAPPPQQQADGQDVKFTKAQLEQMVAPVALYPDELLAQVLIASTYPLELVEADRWLKKNKGLKGDALAAEIGKQRWDDSIKALSQVPYIITAMADNLEKTQRLGDAVLGQQDEVMAAVQDLRKKAHDAGMLKDTKEQVIHIEPAAGSKEETPSNEAQPRPEVQPQGGGQATGGQGAIQPASAESTIAISSASPGTVSVPYYDPNQAYGSWDYPEDPPYSYPPPSDYGYGSGWYGGGYPPGGWYAGMGLAFLGGIALGGSDWWHGDCDWGGNNITINNDWRNNWNNGNNNFRNRNQVNPLNRPGAGGAGTRWAHNPAHRRGVPYASNRMNRQFAPNRANRQGSAAMRQQFRGQLAQGNRDLGNRDLGNRGNPGQRGQGQLGQGGRNMAGNRTANNHPSTRPANMQRASNMNRASTANRPSNTARNTARPSNAGRAQNMARNTARPSTMQRPSSYNRGNAMSGVGNAQMTRAASMQGRTSMQNRNFASGGYGRGFSGGTPSGFRGGGGGGARSFGGGGFRGGGGGGFRGGGGGRGGRR